MKKYFSFSFALTCLLAMPCLAQAQSFETVDACKNLRQEITAAVEASKPLAGLLTDKAITQEKFLAELYEGVKVLSKSGEMFFKASDSHESTCKSMLTQAGKQEEIRMIYDWYLEPVQIAHAFFHRAREAAIHLNRQADVDAFNTTMSEYDAAVMKLVGVCESDLANTPSASTCSQLSAKLGDVLK
jgi:hypothetical protein